MSHSTQLAIWDGPRVRTEQFEAAFLPNAGEDLESVDNVDVFVAVRLLVSCSTVAAPERTISAQVARRPRRQRLLSGGGARRLRPTCLAGLVGQAWPAEAVR
jgi:hypothetical protein